MPSEVTKTEVERDDEQEEDENNIQEQEQEQQTLEIYRKALTFNVIAKYDPLINQLIHLSSYCVVYKYEENDWNKLDYQGPIAFYSRSAAELSEATKFSVEQVLKQDHYKYGLIILNRAKPENFTIGFLGNDNLIAEDAGKGMFVESKEKLVIVRDFKGDTFGLWLFDPQDREYLYKFLKYCVDN
ncbi:hypothetical protein FOA43_003138 [Brettanomyces nanus]|uniref:Uncharacterized protein n=1 Tax=Eeniella nana TaxID=13502 RepID=A0A875RVS3_EENNA|nr:uncharacterized protein FOA43_003138 [Brettanomyces nanus]QPG75777.1 hypothetical protein FOA43_003138 [Brettanomyces nanus]